MGSASLGSRAYFAGGYNGTNSIAVVESYDTVSGKWDTPGNLSVPRSNFSGVACGTKILFAGGLDWNSFEYYSTVDIYDTVSHEWTLGQLSVPRFDLSAVSCGNKVLFAGGALFDLTCYDVVDVYDIQADTWTTTAISLPRAGMAAAVVGDLAFFAGGVLQDGNGSNRVDIYDFSTNTWRTDTLSLPRAWAAATAVGDKVIIAGGLTSMGYPSDRVDIYDTSKKTWHTAALSVFNERGFIGAATVNGRAYFAGGSNMQGGTFYSRSDAIDIYNESTNSWSMDNLTQSISCHSVVGLGKYLLVAGGQNEGGMALSNVEIYHDNPGWGIAPHTTIDKFFRVFPNPGNGNFRLEMLRGTYLNPVTVKIYNFQGQLVINQQLAPGDKELEVDLPAGIFLMSIVADNFTGNGLITILR